MMFTVLIQSGNEAFFDPAPEIARILRALADETEARTLPVGEGHEATFTLRDVNGNPVGGAIYTSREAS